MYTEEYMHLKIFSKFQILLNYQNSSYVYLQVKFFGRFFGSRAISTSARPVRGKISSGKIIIMQHNAITYLDTNLKSHKKNFFSRSL